MSSDFFFRSAESGQRLELNPSTLSEDSGKPTGERRHSIPQEKTLDIWASLKREAQYRQRLI
ncbi:hypothetical protein D3C81_464350 [compost metagenome]